MLQGTGVLNIISMGKVVKLEEEELELTKFSNKTTEEEIEKYYETIKKFEKESLQIIDNVKKNVGEKEASIIENHILIANDKEIVKSIEEKIKDNKFTVEWAISEAFEEFINIFKNIEDELISQRASDLYDVKTRLLYILKNKQIDFIKEKCIIVTKDFTPSQISKINKDLILGIITEIGGKTSHTAILSQTMNIPAILGVQKANSLIKEGDFLIMDCEKGNIIINPGEEECAKYKELMEKQSKKIKLLDVYKNKETFTKDKEKIHIYGNISRTEHVKNVLENGGEGIGLLRTEFLYMDRENFATEEEQFEIYKKILESFPNKNVVIRTLDVGGDKNIKYFNLEKEDNPFLGYRGIRICLDKVDIFKVQLRALLRASIYGNLKIMLPLIVNLQEIIKAREIIEEVKKELTEENIKFSKNIEIGIMIETPSAAITADILAKESNFFSIGSNDLIQYTMAADRGNDKISYLYTEYSPGVLRLIKNIIEISKENNIQVSMCGEVAQNKYMIPFLIGVGLKKFSVSPSSILEIKKIISDISYKESWEIAEKTLKLKTDEEVYNYLKNIYDKNIM